MPTYNTVAFLCDLILSLLVVVLIYRLIAPSLRELLDRIVRLPEGTTFYIRVLGLVLACLALSRTIVGIHEKPEAHAIEYAWAVAAHLSDVFQDALMVLLAYVLVVTILVVVLRFKNGQ
jgi:hypothetical protein